MVAESKRQYLSRVLGEYRKLHGFSQRELGEIVGVKTLTILRWERGQFYPSNLAIKRLKEVIRGIKL